MAKALQQELIQEDSGELGIPGKTAKNLVLTMCTNFQYVTSIKGKKLIKFNEYLYRKRSSSSTNSYWSCTKSSCGSRANLNLDISTLETTFNKFQHNHRSQSWTWSLRFDSKTTEKLSKRWAQEGGNEARVWTLPEGHQSTSLSVILIPSSSLSGWSAVSFMLWLISIWLF